MTAAGQKWFKGMTAAGQKWFKGMTAAGQKWFKRMNAAGQKWFKGMTAAGQKWFKGMTAAGRRIGTRRCTFIKKKIINVSSYICIGISLFLYLPIQKGHILFIDRDSPFSVFCKR